MVFVIYIYILQILIIFCLGYLALKKGSTMYDWVTFKGFKEVYGIPVWVFTLPFVGSIMTIIVSVVGLIYVLNNRFSNYLKEYLKFKVK